MPECARLALEAIADGMCVVIGLQSTGEANTKASLEETGETMDDFVSAPQRILLAFLKNHFPLSGGELSTASADALLTQVRFSA